MKFKSSRLNNEFEEIHPKLRAILLGLEYDLVENRFFNFLDKELTITHLCRTQEEQDEFYKHKIDEGFFCTIDGKVHYSKNKTTPTLSKHQLKPCRASDIRIADLSHIEREFIKEWLKKYFPESRLVEDAIAGSHFHIEI